MKNEIAKILHSVDFGFSEFTCPFKLMRSLVGMYKLDDMQVLGVTVFPQYKIYTKINSSQVVFFSYLGCLNLHNEFLQLPLKSDGATMLNIIVNKIILI